MLATVGYALDVQPPPCPLPELPMLVGWHPRDTQDARLRWLRQQLEACVAQGVPKRRR